MDICTFSDLNYAGDKRDRISTSDYCTYVEGNVITCGVRRRMFCFVPMLKQSIEL